MDSKNLSERPDAWITSMVIDFVATSPLDTLGLLGIIILAFVLIVKPTLPVPEIEIKADFWRPH